MLFSLNHSVPLLHYPHHCSWTAEQSGPKHNVKCPKLGLLPGGPQIVTLEIPGDGYHFQ